MSKRIILTERFQSTEEDPLSIECMTDSGEYVPITDLSAQFSQYRLSKDEKAILAEYRKLELPPTQDKLQDTAATLKKLIHNDAYSSLIDAYCTKVSEGFTSAKDIKPIKDAKPARARHTVSEHLWAYVDDPAVLMVSLHDKDQAARYVKNDVLIQLGIGEDEMRRIAQYRKLLTQIEGGEDFTDNDFYAIFPALKDTPGSHIFITKETLVKRNEALASKALPAGRENQPMKKEMKVQPGSSLALAAQLGMPSELADLFFLKIDGAPYIRNPGLLFIAQRQGKGAIEVTDVYDEKTKTWSATSSVYPQITVSQIDAIARLDPSVQRDALLILSRPSTGIGTANIGNVRNTKMHPFLREMAQTRAQNRALRGYTGYGGTSAEEMPEGVVEGVTE